MQNRVIGIYYTHENEALLCGSIEYCRDLNRKGFDADHANVGTSEGLKKLGDALASGQTAFCFGLQGVGSNLTRNDVNLWTATRVPFLGIHYDNPCYNRHNHVNASPYVANLYHARSFLEIQQRYLGGNQVNGLLPPEIFDPMHPSSLPFEQRPIKYLYLKTGETLDELEDYFSALPPAVGNGARELLEQAWQNPNLSLCDIAAALMRHLGYDIAAYPSQFWSLVQAMDYYLRRKRAIEFVNWLKMQEGAVIIGNGWDFIDKTGAKAEFRPAISVGVAIKLYEQAQFICNTNPYGRDLIHERVLQGLMQGCRVISDRNEWWERHFTDVPALTMFDWKRPLCDQLDGIADRPDAAAAAATGRTAVLRELTGHNYIAQLIAYADKVRQHAATVAL